MTPEAQETFSPLLIGERGATTVPEVIAMLVRSFSPLLIGERGATAASPFSTNHSISFQSPPHRGTWCDGTAGKTRSMPSPCSLSVPSSSGNVVRRPAPAKTRPATPPFSPLLIGERGATAGPSRSSSWTRTFSPLLIGERGAPGVTVDVQWSAYAFSPLLIGERGATLFQVFPALSEPNAFSPLLIGERGATYGLVTPELAAAAFSPLLIGERGATLGRLFTRNHNRVFQSPPHRGTWCDRPRPRH